MRSCCFPPPICRKCFHDCELRLFAATEETFRPPSNFACRDRTPHFTPKYILLYWLDDRGGGGHGPGASKSTPVGFCVFSDRDPEPESKICEKPDPESLFIFRQYQESACLFKCHCLSTSVAEFRLRRLFAGA